jgi:hypothetical protein
MLAEQGGNGDLFEGLVQGVNLLPPREREAIVLRKGVGDRVHDVDEVALAIGCPADQVPQLERHALNILLSQPASLEACWRLEDLCAKLGLGWDDGRLPTVVAARYPRTRTSFTRLVAWLMHEKGQLAADASGHVFVSPPGIAHFEEMVVAALGRYGNLTDDDLGHHVSAALSTTERERYPDFNAPERVKILGPAHRADDGMFRLPDAPIPGLDDRRIRALNGLIGALQRLGTARISALTTEVNRRLPRTFHINDQYIKTWLTRHPDLFTESDPDRFKLATLDLDILCGLSTSWMPGDTVPSVTGSRPGAERVATEIAELLRVEGPLPIARIRSHLYGRLIGLASADVVIAQNPHRFTRQAGGLVTLLDGEAPAPAQSEPIVAKLANAPRRVAAWLSR